MLVQFIVLGVLLLLLTIPFIIRLVWHMKLLRFQKRNYITPSKAQNLSITNHIAMTSILLLLGLFMIVGGSTPSQVTKTSYQNYTSPSIQLESAQQFKTQIEFNNYFENLNYNSHYEFRLLNSDYGIVGSGSKETTAPDMSDTYTQVKGVSEADVAKITPDGKYIIYGNKYQGDIHRVSLSSTGEVTETYSINIKNFNFYDLFIYENKAILFGSIYNMEPYEKTFFDIWMRSNQSQYIILDINTMQELSRESVIGVISEVRLIEEILYLVTSDYINPETSDYKDIYYFKGESNMANVTRIYSVDLQSNQGVSHVGFVGSMNGFYMGNGQIVLTTHQWDYSANSDFYNQTNVILIGYDQGKLAYKGSQTVYGIPLNQYFIDVFEDQIRMVTTFGKDNQNALYIFKENPLSDKLTLVGHLSEGLGKPNEHVKSVTFTEKTVKIVTFLQTDPLYTIDLSNPSQPTIINVIEEPGFSSSLIVWDELGHTIGIGYMADEQGRTNGIKVSAYNQSDSEPIQTIAFSYEEYGYIYADVLHSQRTHLLMSKTKNVFGFISVINGYYDSRVLLFHVDFNEAQPLTLNDLFDKSFTDSPDKLMLINDFIHILSHQGVVTFNLLTNDLGALKPFVVIEKK